MDRWEFVNTLNTWGRNRVPFLFLVDFEQEAHVASTLASVRPEEILFDLQGFTNAAPVPDRKKVKLAKFTIPFAEYEHRFGKVMDHLRRGNSYLINLTIKTEIRTDLDLRDLFFAARAKYKVYVANQFLFFSPESFVRIEKDIIYSNPMKGTIDAAVPNAREVILQDPKELSEHVTIVDLIRNDLSQVADHVVVKRFRYVEELKTHDKILLQVSSEIAGQLAGDYWSRIGDIFAMLLPAGSVSGAPKARTLEIIRETEMERRGYYSGVCGYFDGDKLDSCVMIRFIESVDGTLYYRSGGGITTQSQALKEYQEAIGKIYVPVD